MQETLDADYEYNKKWPVMSAKWRQNLNVTREYNPFSKLVNLEDCFGEAPTPRVADLVECAVIQACQAKSVPIRQWRKALKGQVLDVSQSHDRRPLSGPILRTLTTSSKLFYFDQLRFLQGREHLLLHGYEEEIHTPKNVSDQDLRRFAGEGIALPCLGVVVFALYLTKNFHQ